MKELITKSEYELMDLYRSLYAGESDNEDHEYEMIGTFASSYDILTEWEKAKSQLLFNLLGNQFMISKKVEFTEDWGEHEDEINNLWSSPFMRRVRKFNDELYNSDREQYYSDSHCHMMRILEPNYKEIWDNKIEFDPYFYKPTDEKGKTINFRYGDKWIRAVGKIVKLMGWPEDEFEDFRNQHSRIIQNKKTSGTLTLSIHPMDYMTMSDNCSDWTSCMSWAEYGCYRHGTVEMMNSPCVLVAYLASDNTTYYIGSGKEWNNKKYRQLVIVDPAFITTVRPYPNENTALDEAIISWVQELMIKNINPNLTWSKTYSYNPSSCRAYDWAKNTPITDDEDVKDFKIRFNTLNMYNDFCHNTHKISVSNIGKEMGAPGTLIEWEYSGASQCMWCGELYPHLESEESLCCTDCYKEYNYYNCEICEDNFDESEVIITPDGYIYCTSCYENTCIETSNPDWSYRYRHNDMKRVYVYDETTGELVKNSDENYDVCLFSYNDFHSNFRETKCSCCGIDDIFGTEYIYYIGKKTVEEMGLKTYSMSPSKIQQGQIANINDIQKAIFQEVNSIPKITNINIPF